MQIHRRIFIPYKHSSNPCFSYRYKFDKRTIKNRTTNIRIFGTLSKRSRHLTNLTTRRLTAWATLQHVFASEESVSMLIAGNIGKHADNEPSLVRSLTSVFSIWTKRSGWSRVVGGNVEASAEALIWLINRDLSYSSNWLEGDTFVWALIWSFKSLNLQNKKGKFY